MAGLMDDAGWHGCDDWRNENCCRCLNYTKDFDEEKGFNVEICNCYPKCDFNAVLDEE